MRHRKPPPDKRLNWRDPNMPVLRPAMAPGDTKYKLYEFRADWVQNWHKENIRYRNQEREWKYDPSYWWARDKKK